MQSGDCLPGFTNQFGESSSDRQAMRRVPPELSKPVRRASHRPPRRERASPASPIDRHCTNAERRLLLLSQRRERVPRLPQPVRRVVLRPPSTAASFPSTAAQGTSFSGFSEQSKPMRRVNPLIVPSTAASPSDRAQGTSLSDFPELSNQCGESPHAPPNSGRVSFASPNFAANCAQNKNSTALTIGNEGIQIQWPSRAHTRKHEAALPPVLMFFL